MAFSKKILLDATAELVANLIGCPQQVLTATYHGGYQLCAASVLSLGVCENRDGWLVAWGFCG